MIIEHFWVILRVLRALRMDDLCNFDNIMYAINEALISLIIFGINLRFLLKLTVRYLL